MREFVVRPNCSGMSLFHFLRRVLPRSMSRDVLALVLDGQVLVNGRPGDVHQTLRSGDYLTVDASTAEERLAPAAPERLPVLYRDDGVICVDKPAGVPVIPDRRPKGPTAVEIVRGMVAPEGLTALPVHRIDKHTSGVLLLALRKEFVEPLGALFAGRQVLKTYLAFVRGIPIPREGVIDAPIGLDRRRPGRMMIGGQSAKPAVTRYRVAAEWMGYSLVEARPETGRTHQIRVHLAHIKNPILCDSVYGGGESFHLSTVKPDYRIGRGKRERPIISRLGLHAAEIAFVSPATGRSVTVRAPLARDLAVLQGKLEKFARG